jgi:hypothetical protein
MHRVERNRCMRGLTRPGESREARSLKIRIGYDAEDQVVST